MTYRVITSFYVEAENAKEAERLVLRELNSRPIQKLVGDTIGDADVHEGETEEWDLDG